MRSTQPDHDGTRTIRGQVRATTGVVTAGTGFMVTRNSVGNFTVRLLGALRSISVFNATIQQTGGFIVASPSTIDQITVLIFNSATATADFDWSFEVTGLAR